ncbi:unnamed protein product [Prorocentrum cordatum]|uniref:Thioredoxin domain-containing protein n=1 Tax=Prorocentrum cordatum TaxID=2364126 RepID=A0ABN9T5X9_9DINO|nr:unnamed protein product [Polarella glacialis]
MMRLPQTTRWPAMVTAAAAARRRFVRQGPAALARPSAPGASRRRLVTEVASAAQYEELLREPQPPALVFYTAAWCVPCREMESYVKGISDDRPRRLRVLRVDVEEHADLARRESLSTSLHLVRQRERRRSSIFSWGVGALM